MAKLRVLAVDDSVVMRRLLNQALSSEPEIESVVTAANGSIALGKIAQSRPDMVILDVDMPKMGGIQTLNRIRADYPHLPVLMLSAGSDSTALEALVAGASEYVFKPDKSISAADSLQSIRDALIPKIRALAVLSPSRENAAVPARTSIEYKPIEVIAIGTSTGGPNALNAIIPEIRRSLRVPMIVVQHMTAGFIPVLTQFLSSKSKIPVIEATQGQTIRPGNVYMAPSNFHLTVARGHDGSSYLNLVDGPPENSCKPAADVLFRSVAEVYGPSALALVLTGMGQDGYKGSESIYAAGGRIWAQDEATSVVWGMPSFVVRAGLAEKVLPVTEIAAALAGEAANSETARFES